MSSFTLKVTSFPVGPTNLTLEMTLRKFLKRENIDPSAIEHITYDHHSSYIRFFQSQQYLQRFLQYLTAIGIQAHIRYEVLVTEEELYSQLPGHLYVRGIPISFTTANLMRVFAPYGDIESCKIVQDGMGVSKKYGFVSFATRLQANAAIIALNGRSVALDGGVSDDILFVNHHVSKKERLKQLKLKTTTFSNICVKNMPLSVESEEVRALFDKFGTIGSVFMPADLIDANTDVNLDPKGVGLAFINYKYHEDAIDALSAMNNYEIRPGFFMQIVPGHRKRDKERYENLSNHFSSSNNTSVDYDYDYTRNDDHGNISGLEPPLSPFEHSRSPSISSSGSWRQRQNSHNHSFQNPPPVTTSKRRTPSSSSTSSLHSSYYPYSFNYSSDSISRRVLSSSHQQSVPLAMSVPSQHAFPSFIVTSDSKIISTTTGLPIAGPQFQDSNLYVVHIPHTFADLDLQKLFEPYGKIKSCKIITYQRDEIDQLKDKSKVPVPETGASKGFGFVSFENPLDASKALISMNGYKIDNDHTLNVTFAQKREDKMKHGKMFHYTQNHLTMSQQYPVPMPLPLPVPVSVPVPVPANVPMHATASLTVPVPPPVHYPLLSTAEREVFGEQSALLPFAAPLSVSSSLESEAMTMSTPSNSEFVRDIGTEQLEKEMEGLIISLSDEDDDEDDDDDDDDDEEDDNDEEDNEEEEVNYKEESVENGDDVVEEEKKDSEVNVGRFPQKNCNGIHADRYKGRQRSQSRQYHQFQHLYPSNSRIYRKGSIPAQYLDNSYSSVSFPLSQSQQLHPGQYPMQISPDQTFQMQPASPMMSIPMRADGGMRLYHHGYPQFSQPYQTYPSLSQYSYGQPPQHLQMQLQPLTPPQAQSHNYHLQGDRYYRPGYQPSPDSSHSSIDEFTGENASVSSQRVSGSREFSRRR